MASLSVKLTMPDDAATERLKEKYGETTERMDDTASADIVIELDIHDDVIRTHDPVDFPHGVPEISLDDREKMIAQLIVAFSEHVAARICAETDAEWREFSEEDIALAEAQDGPAIAEAMRKGRGADAVKRRRTASRVNVEMF